MITADSEDFDSEEVAASVTVLISTVDEVKGNVSVRFFSLGLVAT